jgi:hypothetical protein
VLTNDERAAVQHAFAEALASRADPQSLIKVVFLTEASSVLLDIPSGATPWDISAFTVNACLLSRWARDPSLLETLLEYLVHQQGLGSFVVILARVRQRIDPNPTVYDSSWLLDNSRPFFNRHELRKHVRLLIEHNGRPILRVSADKQSFGRSYTARFFEHLEDFSPKDLHVLAAEVSRSAGPSYQVEDLLDELSTQLTNSSPLPDRVGSSYPTVAARWLLREMMRSAGLWIVALDGFGQRPLNDEVRETVEDLAYRVTVGQHRRRVRLVLLDYPHPLPNVSAADVLEETLPAAASIRQADLMPCLQAWDGLRRRNGLVGVASGELSKLAHDMIEQAPTAGKARLATLNAQLIELLGMP